MKVRFISSLQQQLYSRGVNTALDAWTVHSKTTCGKLVVIPPSHSTFQTHPPRVRHRARARTWTRKRPKGIAMLTVAPDMVVDVTL